MPLTLTMMIAAAVSSASSSNTTELRGQMGINLSGCEFINSGVLCPNASDIDWYIDQGFKVIRVPFRDKMDPAKLHPIIQKITARGGYVILDRHDYKWPQPAEQVAFWTKAVGPYAKNSHVLIDVMNEPRGFNDADQTNDWSQWASEANEIVAGLRRAGLNNMLLMEWPAYSAAYKFDNNEADSKPCSSAACALDRIGGLKDPLGRTLLSPHLYFDRWSSGTVAECIDTLNLDRAREAAAKRGYRLFLGESAFGNYRGVPDSCQAVGRAAVNEIKSHPETWAGVTWWGGGRAWNENYLFKVEPKKGTRAKTSLSAYAKAISGR